MEIIKSTNSIYLTVLDGILIYLYIDYFAVSTPLKVLEHLLKYFTEFVVIQGADKLMILIIVKLIGVAN